MTYGENSNTHEKNNIFKNLGRQFQANRPRRLEDIIKMNIWAMRCDDVHWILLDRHWVDRRVLMYTMMNIPVPQMQGITSTAESSWKNDTAQ
jgi:hypothetical protein